MINLLKKDLMACFKADIKSVIKLLMGIILFSLILLPTIPIAVPFFISYIFILRSFQIDELNKCDYFFNSLPIEKEDIVYSKYLFSTIVIMVSLIFTFIYSKVINSIWKIEFFDLDSVLMIVILLLLLASILLPLMFKYGYKKSYVIVNLIIAICIIVLISSKVIKGIYFSYIGEVDILRDKTLIIKSALAMIAYLVSMFISIKIYIKKEIAS